MAGLEKSLFNLKFTAKQLNRQSAKATKDETHEKAKLKKALAAGNNDIARIYAQNAIRQHSQSLNLLRLSSRLDAVSSRIQTALTMRTVSTQMASVVKSMDSALGSMNLERISAVMDKFETQFEDLDVSTAYYEGVASEQAVGAGGEGVDEVEELIRRTGDEVGIETKQGMEEVPEEVKAGEEKGRVKDKEDALGDRLRALRS